MALLQTTNPKLSWEEFFSIKIMSFIIISILLDTIIYILFFNMINFIFFEKILHITINVRLIIFLIILMFIRYIGRLIHNKKVHQDFNFNDIKSYEYINQYYNS